MRVLENSDGEIRNLYRQLQEKLNIEEYQGRSGYDFFHRVIHGSDLVLVYDFGFLRFDKLDYCRSIQVHGAFWSHKVMDRSWVKDTAAFVFRVFDIKKIEVAVPVNRGFRNLMGRLGFCFEGTLRKALNNGIIYEDGDIYSLCKEDIYE